MDRLVKPWLYYQLDELETSVFTLFSSNLVVNSPSSSDCDPAVRIPHPPPTEVGDWANTPGADSPIPSLRRWCQSYDLLARTAGRSPSQRTRGYRWNGQSGKLSHAQNNAMHACLAKRRLSADLFCSFLSLSLVFCRRYSCTTNINNSSRSVVESGIRSHV